MHTPTLTPAAADPPAGAGRLARRGLLAATGLTALGLARAQGQSSVAPGDERAPALPKLGQTLPLVDVPLLDGTVLRAADLQGKVLVVYWWASWCPFCAEQSPHVEALWRRERTRGLQVLGLSIDKTAAAATAYLQRKGFTFPAGLLSPEVAKVLPKPRGLPVTVVRGRSGNVVFAEAGQLFPEDVEGLAKYL